MEPTFAPYGNWKSNITADLVSQVPTHNFMDVSVDQVEEFQDKEVYWIESIAAEGGRCILFSYNLETDQRRSWTPADFSVRTRVHEYGGGAFVVIRGAVVFSNMNDQRLYRQTACDATPTPLTAPCQHFYADGHYSVTHDLLFCVRENHEIVGNSAAGESAAKEPENTIVQVKLNSGKVTVVVKGSDFYSSPRVSRDGSRLLWIEWSHPNMPWDDTRLMMASLSADGLVEGAARVVVSGGPDRELSVLYPTWTKDGGILYVADHEEFWDIHHVDVEGSNRRRIFSRGSRDAVEPPWSFNRNCFGYMSGPDAIAINSVGDGMIEVSVADGSQRVLAPHPERAGFVRGAASGQRVFATALDFRSFPSLVCVENGACRPLAHSCSLPFNDADISVPRHIEFDTTEGDKAFAFYYPPRNAAYRAPHNATPPPLIVTAHGGPTSSGTVHLQLSVQFWTSRGFALLDVDYRGSTSYGRRFRSALRGKWGLYDVDDCCAGVQYLVRENLADRDRICIRGGSAGGFTTLSCLAFREVFTAGASHYGICDLSLLQVETHKFESRYMDRLVGPWPAARHVYTQRSPIHVLDRFTCPVVFFHGEEDTIVPPNQAELMFNALKEKGVMCAYLLFPGERHGFRKKQNIVRALNAELYFYAKVFDLEPESKEDILQICNLDSRRRRLLSCE